MDWITRFKLFLFDFDGLLVNTEHLHHQAYMEMMNRRGYDLGWSFSQFCKLAHSDATALKQAFYAECPLLNPNWSLLYQEKKEIYLELVKLGKVTLMPGVDRLLKTLDQQKIKSCVVTNSPLEQIKQIRSHLPLLESIPHWITREQYSKPKPDPECYLKAIQLYGEPGGEVVGFEDSLRGLQALSETPAMAILICSSDHPLLEISSKKASGHYESFEHLLTHIVLPLQRHPRVRLR